jgi:hypothetical protein
LSIVELILQIAKARRNHLRSLASAGSVLSLVDELLTTVDSLSKDDALSLAKIEAILGNSSTVTENPDGSYSIILK